YITVENPVSNSVSVNNLTSSKADTLSHGYGIFNMKSIAKKYNGEVLFTIDDNMFKTNIYMKNIPTK
ncbi:MAG: GHKL domain-containing protein, partial [Clostridia bacterium]|nr:GHKL domain-containing protein [Clostridia bacterium]